MRTFSVSFFLGTLLLLVLPRLPEPNVLFLLAVCAVIVLASAWVVIVRRGWRKWPVLALTGVLAGSLYALSVASNVHSSWLPQAQEGEDILLEGVIADLPERREDGLHFLLDADSSAYTGRLRLGWYEDDAPEMRAGERWQLLVRGKRPNGFSNPNGFDYEQWLFAQRIGGTGYVRKSADNQRLAEAPWWSVDNVRQQVRDAIATALPDASMLGVVQGLAVADTAAVTQDQWEIFRKTGTIHLLAISGLHITMMAGLGLLPVWLVWRLFPNLYLRLPLRVAAGLLGGGLATGYSLLAGFNIPTQRTLAMLLVMVLGLVWRRQIPFSVTLCLALLLVLLLDPLASLSVGFWLSFLSVMLLVLLGGRQRKAGKAAVVWVQLLMSLGTIPLAAGFFGMVSLSSPLANMLAIPVVTFVVTPLVLLGMLLCGWWSTGAALVWSAAAWLLDWLGQALAWLADLPLSAVYLPLVPLPWLALALLGFVLLCLPRGLPGRWLGVLLLLPMLLYSPDRPEAGAFRVDVLDVGQGLASVVQTAQHTLVFDTGPKSSETFDTGELVLLPWLRGQGISHLDRLIVSHADNDHSGGAQALWAEMPADDLWVSHLQTLPGVAENLCGRGQHWEWDGVTFTILSPAEGLHEASDNNRACVLRVANAHHSMLFTADIERPAEEWLVEAGGLASEVLQVPHHGSKTSSSPDFINAVAPQLAIITSGYRNRFHHPNPSVVERYTARDIKLLDTVDGGELCLDFPAFTDNLRIREWRREQKHVWQDYMRRLRSGTGLFVPESSQPH
ncbi:MAG: DNA internalization-related competence protein ComEC/Rec2 [Thiothrix sp.]|uniref:DNA internalization-related competence protein ComEC/Rec2 n=1 Tax=Thiothrix sp. TaxID=1032 RepID=UPI00260C3D7D|nr:DNA internalization-related competence protein ComEC/Rec2 [Thiothrix sp.]MDD5394168.1 DNA internalization-related competence protein ComEC/Rec2 [Thiothrix sp.]